MRPASSPPTASTPHQPDETSDRLGDIVDVKGMQEFLKSYRARVCACTTHEYHDFIFSNIHRPRRLLEVRVELLINNKVVSALALIDIGATHTFMAHSFITRHNVKTQELGNTMRVHVANGAGIATNHRTTPLVLRIGDAYAEPTSFISLDLVRYDILLGLDWLEKHDAVLYTSARKMVFYTQCQIRRTRVEHTLYVGCTAPPPPPQLHSTEASAECEESSEEDEESESGLKQIPFKKILRFAKKKGVEMFRVTLLQGEELEEGGQAVEINTTALSPGVGASEHDSSMRSSTARVLNMLLNKGGWREP